MACDLHVEMPASPLIFPNISGEAFLTPLLLHSNLAPGTIGTDIPQNQNPILHRLKYPPTPRPLLIPYIHTKIRLWKPPKHIPNPNRIAPPPEPRLLEHVAMYCAKIPNAERPASIPTPNPVYPLFEIPNNRDSIHSNATANSKRVLALSTALETRPTPSKKRASVLRHRASCL